MSFEVYAVAAKQAVRLGKNRHVEDLENVSPEIAAWLEANPHYCEVPDYEEHEMWKIKDYVVVASVFNPDSEIGKTIQQAYPSLSDPATW